jgi:hypothetical protein
LASGDAALGIQTHPQCVEDAMPRVVAAPAIEPVACRPRKAHAHGSEDSIQVSCRLLTVVSLAAALLLLRIVSLHEQREAVRLVRNARLRQKNSPPA